MDYRAWGYGSSALPLRHFATNPRRYPDFQHLLGNNCGRSGQILQLYLDNTKQPPYTDTNREREQLGFKIHIYNFLNMSNLGDTLLP